MAKYNPAANRSRLKAYKRVGIRRDQDLSDLSNTARGLENLLNSLVDETGESFSINDLNSIKNIFARGLDASNYQNIVGSSVKFTTPAGNTVEYDPRITYQNRINKFEIFTGNPRLGGGDGLTANYYQNDQINFSSHSTFKYTKPNGDPLDVNDSESDIFLPTTTEGKIPSDNFWELGDFQYTGKVHPQSVKANAGVKWEGYYIPRNTGRGVFRIDSSGYYSFDFAKDGYFEDDDKNQTADSVNAIGAGNTYTSYARVGLTTTIIANGVAGNNLLVAANRIPTVGIGMSVSGANINSAGGAPIVSSIDHATGLIGLSPVEGQSNSVTGNITNGDVTFTRVFGSRAVTRIRTQVLLSAEKYRIRIRYFHPQVSAGDTVLNDEIKNIQKRITIEHQPPFFPESDDLHHQYLYPLDYDFSESAKGTFNTYSDKSVLFGGTKLGVGIGERNDFNKYVKLKTSNKVDLKYKVKKSLAEITKTQRTGGLTDTSKIVTMGITSSIEIGNYVFGSGIPDETVVEDITTNQFLVLSKEATVTGDKSLKFIDHRGFVKKVSGTHANVNNKGEIDLITPDLFDQASRNANTGFQTIDTDVQVGMVAIGANLNQYSVITSMPSTDKIVLDQSVSSTGIQDVYIYQSRGLKDNSLQNFCDRFNPTPEVRCLVSNHETTDANGDVSTYTLPGNAGITTIRVDDINSVGVNWELQGAYFGTDGIKVDSINAAEKILTLKSQITRPLPDGAQFTAVGTDDTIVNQDGDYQLCCPPTDTSPPFNAAEEGLETTPDHKNFQVVSGNLIFDSIIMKDTTGNAANLAVNDAMTVDRKIEIKTPLSTNTKKFKLLATT